ncbi:MAG: acylphosphatase [Patescibacteria group bacterium]
MNCTASAETDIKRINALVSGKVQGVFFRAYTQKKAQEKGISGWVRNLKDGRVEVVAEGAERSIERFIEFLWEGSPSSRVDDVSVKWQEPEGKSGFYIE